MLEVWVIGQVCLLQLVVVRSVVSMMVGMVVVVWRLLVSLWVGVVIVLRLVHVLVPVLRLRLYAELAEGFAAVAADLDRFSPACLHMLFAKMCNLPLLRPLSRY